MAYILHFKNEGAFQKEGAAFEHFHKDQIKPLNYGKLLHRDMCFNHEILRNFLNDWGKKRGPFHADLFFKSLLGGEQRWSEPFLQL